MRSLCAWTGWVCRWWRCSRRLRPASRWRRFTPGFAIAAASMARVLLFGISVYVFFFVRGAAVSFNIVRVLFWAAVGSAVFACLDFYFQFPAPGGYGPQFIWLESGVFRRAQGVFYEASTLGNLCAFFLEMIAVALFRPRAREAGFLSRDAGGRSRIGVGAGVVLFARIAGEPRCGAGGAVVAQPEARAIGTAAGRGCRLGRGRVRAAGRHFSRFSRGPTGCGLRSRSPTFSNRRTRFFRDASTVGRFSRSS